MKRPFFTTQKGQRLALLWANLLSVGLLMGLALQINLVESPRNLVPQLDSANLQSCEVLECGEIAKLANLEPIRVAIQEEEFINFVRVEFVNHGRLNGSRDLRLELRDSNGTFLEAATTRVSLGLKGRIIAEFGFTSPATVIESGTLKLSY